MGRGRPRAAIDHNLVKVLQKQGLKVAEIAQELGVGVQTLNRNLNREGLSAFKKNSATSDEDLLAEVVLINQQFPGYGANQLWCALKTKRLVTRDRVRQMLRIVDPSGVYERSCQMRRIARIEYWVPHAHALWHIDAYLKLGPFKLVIRGGMDGFSRTIVFLEVGTRNTGAAMLNAFRSGVARYTTPLRVRSDKGREMMDVARFMRQSRPDDEKCVITGRSVRNQKIERWWGDLRKYCTGKYIDCSKELERDLLLDTNDPVDIACLHEVYLAPIQADLYQFRLNYNSKGIRTLRMRSPHALLRLQPLPRELVVSEPQEAEDELVGIHLDQQNGPEDQGREFNGIDVADHVIRGANEMRRELMSPTSSNLKQEYIELRELVQEAHVGCMLCFPIAV